MSPKVWDGPRNLHSKFGHNRVNKIWDIPDMDKCCQDICCLDKCCRYSWNLFKMVTGRHKVCSGVGEGWWWWWCAKSFSCKTQLLVTLSCGWVGALTIFLNQTFFLTKEILLDIENFSTTIFLALKILFSPLINSIVGNSLLWAVSQGKKQNVLDKSMNPQNENLWIQN